MFPIHYMQQQPALPVQQISTSQIIPSPYSYDIRQKPYGPSPFPNPSFMPVHPDPYSQFTPVHSDPYSQFTPVHSDPYSFSPQRSYPIADLSSSQKKDRYAYKPDILSIPDSYPEPLPNESNSNYGSQREDVQLILYFFKEILTFHRELERCKEDLISKVGFSLSEFYKAFDANQSGQVSAYEMQKVFKKLFEIQMTEEEIKLLILRFSRDKNLLLNFEEFCEIFTPKIKANPTKPKYNFAFRDNNKAQLQMKFDYYLQVLIERIIKITITAENSYSFIKKKMQEKQINLEGLFFYMNGNKEGSISQDDLQLMFEIYGFEASEKDIEIIIGFFDKNDSMKIGQKEFLSEFAIKEI